MLKIFSNAIGETWWTKSVWVCMRKKTVRRVCALQKAINRIESNSITKYLFGVFVQDCIHFFLDSLSCISVACDETQQSRAQDRTEKLVSFNDCLSS